MNCIDCLKDLFYRLKGNNQDVVCTVIIHNGKVLAQTAQRSSEVHTNDAQFVVPGGKTEPKEALETAVHREIREETNLEVEILKKLGTSRNNRYKLHWYVCAPIDVSKLKVVEPLKQKELKWVSLNDDQVNWTPKNRIALQKFKPQINEICKTAR